MHLKVITPGTSNTTFTTIFHCNHPSFTFIFRRASHVVVFSPMGRLSTIVAPAEAESAMHVQPIRNLYQNEAGIRRLCECVTVVLENRQQ